MGFLKTADAALMNPVTSPKQWGRMRTASGAVSDPANLVAQASDLLGETFDPAKYLLTHCTIVASVDVENAPNAKTGSFQLSTGNVVRKWTDYLIVPETDRWVNNNNDSFERKALHKAYPTFVGAHNFLEHVQLEELSKGRVIDAAARDIGDSLYIDILVATELAHRELIASIRKEELTTLSMGCSIDHSTCTKCGNVAADEPAMCRHIRFEKGNYWYDEFGKRRRIAELCGHHTVEPHAGINFMDASWVKVPAFTGAVLRSILEAPELSPGMARKVAERLGMPAKVVQEIGIQKAAFYKQSQFDMDEDKEESAKDPSPIQDLEDQVVKMILDRAKGRIKTELQPEEDPGTESIGAPAETIFREAGRATRDEIYRAGLLSLARVASSDIDLINHTALYEKSLGHDLPIELYRASLKIGPRDRYKSAAAFFEACKRVLGRQPKHTEAETMLRLGKLLSLRRHF